MQRYNKCENQLNMLVNYLYKMLHALINDYFQYKCILFQHMLTSCRNYFYSRRLIGCLTGYPRQTSSSYVGRDVRYTGLQVILSH